MRGCVAGRAKWISRGTFAACPRGPVFGLGLCGKRGVGNEVGDSISSGLGCITEELVLEFDAPAVGEREEGASVEGQGTARTLALRNIHAAGIERKARMC